MGLWPSTDPEPQGQVNPEQPFLGLLPTYPLYLSTWRSGADQR